MLLTATSPQLKCFACSNDVSEGIVSSPARKNPKKQKTAAAHNIAMLGSDDFEAQYACIWRRMAGVMGSLTLMLSGER